MLKMVRRNTKMLIVNIQTDSPIFGQLSFPQCHLLRCYKGLCNDIIEKNKDDDIDDVEIGRFLEDNNFENGDECEVVNV